MTYPIFILLSGLAGLFGSIIFAKKNNWATGRIILPILSLSLFATGIFQYFTYRDTPLLFHQGWIRTSLYLHFLNAFFLLELVISFLGKEGIATILQINNRPVKVRYLWRPLIVIVIYPVFFTSWFNYDSNFPYTLHLTFTGELLLSILFFYYFIVLYTVEKIFRIIPTIQKRIFFHFLTSEGIIALGSIIVIIRALFYQELSFSIMQLHSLLLGIFFIGILIGLTRYRLWQENLAIGRGIVYTSFTILFFGIFLVTLGIVATIVRNSHLNFDEFEEFLILFSILFFGILTIFSPQTRSLITVLSRKYIYKSKYDYRDQLLRFHTAHQNSGSIQQTIDAFIDNLQYTIVVKNAFVFIRSNNENAFTCVNKNAAGNIGNIRANSSLIKLFEQEELPALYLKGNHTETILKAIQVENDIFNALQISEVFAIRYQHSLLGLLCISGLKNSLDSEDLMLISMFCESIGASIFREKILSEHIQQKQFESFNHMASFIVHDIKNQVATLSLLTKNAKNNISDPDFHPTLLRSLENSSTNLNSLVNKLQSPPQKEQLNITPTDCNSIIQKSIDEASSMLPAGIQLRHYLRTLPVIAVDTSALYFVIKNLIINAIEAMGQQGSISVFTGVLTDFNLDDTYNFCLTPSDRDNHSTYIMIEDTGPGISRQFLENQLFKPFNTTKDKGIGIGLYQSKILIETMNGRLLCWSEEGKGTRFCILF